MSERFYTVSQVARMARVTVRTLHHYDEIGLLASSQRSEAGYRLYSPGDLQRLHEILIYRELGFALAEIEPLLDAPAGERLQALGDQRELLIAQMTQTRATLDAVDAAIAMLRGDTDMSEEKFDGFGDFDHAKHADEAEQRWGDTEAFAQASRRTKRYGNKEWAEIKAEANAVVLALAELLASGHHPNEPEVTAVAEQHRLHIDRWFYPCSHVMHRGLAQMYVDDERFGAYFERHGEGLAAFAKAAIEHNADRNG